MKFLKNSLRLPTVAIIYATAASISICAQQPVSTDSSAMATDSAVSVAVEEATAVQAIHETPVEQAINQPMPIGGVKVTKILGLTIPFLFVIALIWLLLHFRNERERDRLRLIEVSLNKGCPLPTEFYTSTGKSSPIGKLQSGICWIGAGITIMFFFGNVADDMTPIGILPVFVGIAQIAAYRVQSRKQKESEKYNIPLPKTPRDDQQD